MKKLVEKLRDLELEISSEKGDFSFFGLFLREDAPNKWDLVVASPWIERNQKTSIEYLAKRLRSALTAEELVSLSRIVLMEEGNPALDAIFKVVSIEHGMGEISNSNFYDLAIRQGYVITAKKPDKQQVVTR